MDDRLIIMPFETRHAALIEAWSSQNAAKTLLKLPEVETPAGHGSGHNAWVAMVDDNPIALATINFNEERVGYLDVIVKPNERRQGIGGQLIQYVLEQPEVKEVSKLHALVDQSNVAGQKILEQRGFSRIGYSPEGGQLEFEKH